MKLVPVLIALLSSVAVAASTSLQFVTFGELDVTSVLASGVLPLSGGSVAVYGAQTISGCVPTPAALESCNQIAPPLLTILDASGKQTAALAVSGLGGGNSTIASAAVDATGNIWITGETDSDDFPLVHPLFTNKTSYQLTGFVAKLNPNLNILFSSFLGGQTAPTRALSTPASVAVGPGGNVYISGTTFDPSFPVTGPVLNFGVPAGSEGPPQSEAFIAEIASDGSKLVYSRLLGVSGGLCGPCIEAAPYTAASAIAVDATGEVTVAGTTTDPNFPVSPNAYNTGGGAFVSRISADGSKLVWSTEVGAPATFLGYKEPSSVRSMQLDTAANVYIAGLSSSPILATSGALQATYQASRPGTTGGFALALSSDATKLLFATNLGGMNGAVLGGLALDPTGNVWVSGFTTSPDFPGLSGVTAVGLNFALELNANATALEQIFPLIPRTVSQPPAFDSNANLLLLGSAGNLLRLNPATAYSAPAAFAVTNSAIPQAATSIAPGELMTIYGVGLGPATGLVAAPDSNGVFPTELGGVSVRILCAIGTVSAALLYVGPNQINFEVPGCPSEPATVTVVTPTGSLPPMSLNVAGSIGIFGVLNQDGSVNSASNPAQGESIVSLYLTGLGLATNSATDGVVSGSANSAFIHLVEVDGFPLLYAGTAPDEIDGLDQINVQLPPGTGTLMLTVVVPEGSGTTLPATSNEVAVYIQ
jgi:uncharacterized protein (TIGR03437 family)